MRYMFLWYPDADMENEPPPTEDHMAAMGAFIEELSSAGILIATDGLAPSSQGARIRLSNGKLTVTDGPFTESKELVAGYAIMELPSKEAAIPLARRFLEIAGDGVSELRLMYTPPPETAP